MTKSIGVAIRAIVILQFLLASNLSAERLLVSSIGSERATSGAGNKIITLDGKTHVVWQDATEKGYFNCVRTYDHQSREWSETFTLNRGKDNHARPVIAIDKLGFLHVVLSGHGSPITYRRSIRPNDSSEWTDAVGAGSGTYPVVTCGADGTVFLTMRASNRWNGVDLFVKKPDQPWQKQVKLILRDPELPGYAGFQNGFAWGPKHETLHMVVDFYESVATYKLRGVHQAVCYMRTSDGGKSWQRADGTSVELPARPEQMDILVQTKGDRKQRLPPPFVLAQGCIAVDSLDTPHVFYVSHLDEPGQLMHATTGEQGDWNRTPVAAIAEAFPKMRPVACRGALTIDQDDVLYLLLELKPLGTGWIDGKPTRSLSFISEGKKLIWLVSRDGGKSFSIRDAIDDGEIANQANVERLAGFNQILAGRTPPFIYFDGTSRYRKKGEILQNKVYLVLP